MIVLLRIQSVPNISVIIFADVACVNFVVISVISIYTLLNHHWRKEETRDNVVCTMVILPVLSFAY